MGGDGLPLACHPGYASAGLLKAGHPAARREVFAQQLLEAQLLQQLLSDTSRRLQGSSMANSCGTTISRIAICPWIPREPILGMAWKTRLAHFSQVLFPNCFPSYWEVAGKTEGEELKVECWARLLACLCLHFPSSVSIMMVTSLWGRNHEHLMHENL